MLLDNGIVMSHVKRQSCVFGVLPPLLPVARTWEGRSAAVDPAVVNGVATKTPRKYEPCLFSGARGGRSSAEKRVGGGEGVTYHPYVCVTGSTYVAALPVTATWKISRSAACRQPSRAALGVERNGTKHATSMLYLMGAV